MTPALKNNGAVGYKGPVKIELRTGAFLLNPTTMLPKWNYKNTVPHCSLNYKVQVKLNELTKIPLLDLKHLFDRVKLG